MGEQAHPGQGSVRVNGVDRRGRQISPPVLNAAEEIGLRALRHAQKLFIDPAVATNLLEEAAATVSRVMSARSSSQQRIPTASTPWLKQLVETTLELHRISHSIERPKLDEEWLEDQRSYHSLDLPLPAILLHFRPGDAVMACFDDECEYWGQETPEPNLIIPLRPADPESVRNALAVLAALIRMLVLTVRVKPLLEGREIVPCDSALMSEVNSN